MNDETITRIEREIAQHESARAKAVEANDLAIEREEKRPTGHVDIKAVNVQQLRTKKDSIVSSYDTIIDRKKVELATARIDKAVREADEAAAREAKVATEKDAIKRAYLAAGGPPSEFEAYYQQRVVFQTAAKIEHQKSRVVLPRI